MNNRELHGWWSESAYKSNQRLAIYLRPDGSTVAVTAVGTVNPYIGGYRRRRTDAKDLGVVIDWVQTMDVPSIYPLKLDATIGTSWNKEKREHRYEESPTPAATPTPAKINCDCPWTTIMRTGCQNPRHQ